MPTPSPGAQGTQVAVFLLLEPVEIVAVLGTHLLEVRGIPVVVFRLLVTPRQVEIPSLADRDTLAVLQPCPPRSNSRAPRVSCPSGLIFPSSKST